MRMDPDDPAAAFNLGNLLRAAGKKVEAEAAYRAALKADVHFAEAWYNLADLLEAQGRAELAIDCLQRALEGRSGLCRCDLQPRPIAAPARQAPRCGCLLAPLSRPRPHVRMGRACPARAEILRNQDRAFMTARPKRKAKTSSSSPTSLKRYQEKRDFSRTSEPKPEVRTLAGRRRACSSWCRCMPRAGCTSICGSSSTACSRAGPSPADRASTLGEKRLAVRTEDHPVDYLDFRGQHPQGRIRRRLHDRLGPRPLAAAGDPRKGLQKGHLAFVLDGTRLKGLWHLVRIRPRKGEKTEPWLLMKAEDEFARHPGDPEITEEETTSYLSGRTNQELAAAGDIRVDHAARGKVAKRAQAPCPTRRGFAAPARSCLPAFHEPSLASAARSRRAGRNGCTRSSTTATGCRRASTAARSSC